MTSESFRSEISIPVKKDPRTFVQRENDQRETLERTYTTNSSHTTAPSMSSQATQMSSGANKQLVGFGDNWDSEVSRWLTDSRSNWKRDVDRMRRDMFALDPMDNFGMDNWDNFGAPKSSMMQRSDDMIARMEKQMAQEMSRMGFGGHSQMGFGGRNQMAFGASDIHDSLAMPQSNMPGNGMGSSSSSSFVKQTMSSSVMGADGKCQTKTSSSVSDQRTVDGVTTGHTSHSNEESTRPISMHPTGGLQQLSQHPANVAGSGAAENKIDFIKGSYEIGVDGQLHYKARFNAQNFQQEDINVTTMDNTLTVHARRVENQGGQMSKREFCKSVQLPRQIDHAKFTCTLTNDGVLIIDAPVNAPNYNAITFDNQNNLGIKPSMMNAQPKTEQIPMTGNHEPTILNQDKADRKLHLEVPVPHDLTANDLCVSTDDGKLTVSATKKQPGTDQPNHFVRDFSLHQNIDPLTITAQLFDNVLVIEAPLKSSA